MCSLEFDVKMVGPDTDGSGLIDELVGYQIAHCDNGILDSGGFQTADIITARQFGCYEAPRVKIPAPQPTVKLQDRFGTTTSKPVNLRELCAPADKNGEDPTAPDSPVHISAFDLTNTTGTITHPKGLNITTQFGTLKGDLGTPVFLFTPTSKSLTPPPPPPLAPDALRHFQCYRLANVKGAPKTTGIHLSDQFTESFGGFTVDLDPSGPFRLCVPVNKNDEDPGPRRPAGPAVLHDTQRSPAVQPVHGLRDEPVWRLQGHRHAIRSTLRADDDPALSGERPPCEDSAKVNAARRRARLNQ